MSSLIYCNGDVKTGKRLPECKSGWKQIDASQTELLLEGGFDSNAFQTGFSGVLFLWASGLAIGLIIGQVRKLKRG